MRVVCLLSLFWSLVEVHSQTFPYVSLNGQTLANHSYVDLRLVGNDSSGSDSVQCHTDLSTCCSGAQGPHRGDWYFPNGTRLPFLEMAVSFKPVGIRQFTYAIVVMLPPQLVSIAVIFQQILSSVMMTLQ